MPESGGPYDVAEPPKENDPKDGKYAGREYSAESSESSGDATSWLCKGWHELNFSLLTTHSSNVFIYRFKFR